MDSTDKPRWKLVTGDLAADLVKAGKYRENLPTWVRHADEVWVLVNKAWRCWTAVRWDALRAADRTGNRRCRMKLCAIHEQHIVCFVDNFQNWKTPGCPWCVIEKLEVALGDLLRQVNKFCEEEGEANFYTGNALAALRLSDNRVHFETLDALLLAAHKLKDPPLLGNTL